VLILKFGYPHISFIHLICGCAVTLFPLSSDFDCILTNLELKRLDKNKYQLPEEERERTQSILKRALDVEKGVSEKPPVTEEHPDGCKCIIMRICVCTYYTVPSSKLN